MDEQFQRLIGVSAQEAIHLAETDLTARLMRGEATQVVRDKMLTRSTYTDQERVFPNRK